MAKNYRREKIVKFAKRVLLNNELLLKGLVGDERVWRFNEIRNSFIKEVKEEFDIKEEEIT